MKTVLKNAVLLPEYGYGTKPVCVCVDGSRIVAVGAEIPEDFCAEETVDCREDLLIPAFYNTHCHAAMTLFRGYGEDLPLQRWLDERILPAEDRLSDRSVRIGTRLAIAEMLRGGIASFSDMYMFEESVAEEVLNSGIKANLSRSIVSFDPDADPVADFRVAETESLVKNYHMADDGRIRADVSLHAEYTNVPKMCAFLADYAAERGLRMQLHLSETEKEHREGIGRRKKTPAAFFRDLGVFDVPTTAAHCVFVSEEDIAILAEKHVTVSHNPVSNLKLGSGVMPLRRLLDAGVCVAFGTDGAASNNRLDLLREMQTAAILHKGTSRNPAEVTAKELFPLATRNGALAQGREDCGSIRVGNRADLTLLDAHSLCNLPCYDPYAMLAYSMERADVRLTMVDGRILYRDGAYTSIDEERLRCEAREVLSHYFD